MYHYLKTFLLLYNGIKTTFLEYLLKNLMYNFKIGEFLKIVLIWLCLKLAINHRMIVVYNNNNNNILLPILVCAVCAAT